jgi:hypothetical protein
MHSPTRPRTHPSLAATLLVPLALSIACGAEGTKLHRLDAIAEDAVGGLDEEPTAPAEPDTGTPRLPVEPWLSCVSAPLADTSFGPPRVARATLELQDDGSLRATLSDGLQFPFRSGESFPSDAPTTPRTFTLLPVRDGSGVISTFQTADGEPTTLRVTLTDNGAFPSVELVEDACYVRREIALNCFGALALNAAWIDDVRTRALFPAQFDDERGACVDGRGRLAHNALPLWFVQETGQGACADLRGAVLNGDDLGYPALMGWDLRGADLNGASLHFANLTWASLQGADLGGMNFGYAEVMGFIDDRTTLPGAPVGPGEPGSPCTVSDNPWQGQQVSCRQ